MYDPIDADNAIAKMEEKIRRNLSNIPLKEWKLKDNVHVERTGLYIFECAKENLRKAGEIIWNKTEKQWEFKNSPHFSNQCKIRVNQSK